MIPDPEISEKLISLVRGGGSPESAAAVCGLPPETFDAWKSDLTFLKRLDTAIGEARLLAEVKLKDRSPEAWLNRNKRPKPIDGLTVAQPKEKKLTIRQQKFVREYCLGGIGTKAAIAAGYSTKQGNQYAHQLLSNVEISRAIEKYRAKLLARSDINNERWLREGAIQTFYDPADAFDDNGRLLPIKQMPQQIRHCVARVDVEELFDPSGKIQRGILKKVYFRDRAAWGRMLGQHLGIPTTPDVNLNLNITAASEERRHQLELLRVMTGEERQTLGEILRRAQSRLDAKTNGKVAIETTATPVDNSSPPNRP
jgi:phage terminase small subunit